MTKLINCQHGSIWQERVQNSSPTTTPWTQISVHQTLVMIGTFVSQHLYNAKIFKVSSITNHKLIIYGISISLLFIPNDWKRSTLQTIHIWRLMKSISHIMHPCFHESMNKYIQNTWDVYTWILYPHHLSCFKSYSMDLIMFSGFHISDLILKNGAIDKSIYIVLICSMFWSFRSVLLFSELGN